MAPRHPSDVTTGRIILRGTAAAYVGPSLDLAPHRSAVATVAAALDGTFAIAMASVGRQLGPAIRTPAAVIPPGAHHHVVATGPMAFIYLDAASPDWRALAERPAEALRDRIVDRLRAPDPAGVLDLLGSPAPRDPRAETIRRDIDRNPERFSSINAAAANVDLSPSRLQHLFREGLGVPFRRYRLWRRMALAMRVVRDGGTLTAAAHTAGFASSAHFSTAFRRMFGLAPSRLTSGSVVLDLDG